MKYNEIASINIMRHGDGGMMMKMKIACSKCCATDIAPEDAYCRHCGHPLTHADVYIKQSEVVAWLNEQNQLKYGQVKDKRIPGPIIVPEPLIIPESIKPCAAEGTTAGDAAEEISIAPVPDETDDEVIFVDDATGSGWTLYRYPGFKEGHYDSVTHPCRMVHIKTKNLCAHEADFYVRLADLAKGAMPPKGKWCDKDEKYYNKKLQGVTDSIKSSDDEAWNGRKSTSNMLSHQSEIAAKVNEETCNILPNAPLRHAFIGTILQYKELWSKKELLKDALSFFHLQSAMDDSYWYWTSTQYASSAYNAWYWYASNQAWYNIYGKSTTYVCVPFF